MLLTSLPAPKLRSSRRTPIIRAMSAMGMVVGGHVVVPQRLSQRGRSKKQRNACVRPHAMAAEPKTQLVDRLSGVGPRGWEEARGAVNEQLPKLEQLSSNEPSPATSPTLNGDWVMAFSGGPAPGLIASPTRALALLLYSGGYSPGLAALSVANALPENAIDVRGITLSIGPSQPRARADVTAIVAGQREITASILSDLDVAGESRLRERYVSVEVDGRQIELPSQLRYTRDLYVQYLDDDVLAVRNASGSPDILLRSRSANQVSSSSSEARDTTPSTSSADTTTSSGNGSSASGTSSSSASETSSPESGGSSGTSTDAFS